MREGNLQISTQMEQLSERMKWTINTVCLITAITFVMVSPARAQIPFVTVRTPRSPGPPMALLPTNMSPAPAIPAPTPISRRVVPIARPVQPSLDKAELDRRVVAFQKLRAAEGFSSAQYELGVRYLTGKGVEKDLAAARKWLTLAAAAGEPDARRKLSEVDTPPEQRVPPSVP